jgi:hypothetical protein
MAKAKVHAATRSKKTTKPATTRRKTTARKTASRAKSTSRTKVATRRAASRKSAARKTVARKTTTARKTAKPAAPKVPAAVMRAAQELKTSLAVTQFPDDAIAFLQQDHRKVEALFEEFEKTQKKAEKAALAAKICLELRIHTQIEEEILYPPAHAEIEHDLVDEAVVEHAGAKDLIYQIEAMSPDEHLFDAKVKVLSEYIKHHVKEEETEMFPKLRGHGMNLHEMAEAFGKRKAELIKAYAKAG